MLIRDARQNDAEVVLAIYAPFVRETAVSFEVVPPTAGEMRNRISESTWRWPWLVAEVDGAIAGYAYARPFRTRMAYQFTVETTVYVGPDFHRRGVATCLMQQLLNRLETAGHHLAVAGIALPNDGSVALHERLGFSRVGMFPSVGRKFRAWHDVEFWSLLLSGRLNEIPAFVVDDWRMRILPPTSVEARFLIDRLSSELADRYDQMDDGSGDYNAAQEESDRSVFVVGWLDNSPVACGALRPLTDDVAELKRMFVLPDYRGKKLAPRILQRLELEANRLGYNAIRLETGDRQPEAISLYQKSGYRQIPPFGKYVNSERSVCFEKTISSTGPDK